MAKLPSIEPAESFGPRPIPQPVAGAVSYSPRTGAETAISGAEAEFGQQVEKTTTEFQSLINETKAKDADAAFTQAAINQTYDPQNGYYTKLGKDAVDGYVPAMNAMQAKYKEIRDSLGNPDAQRQYDSYALSTMRRELISMAGHAAQQSKQWQVDTSNSRIKVYQESAANNYNNDVAFGQATNTIKDEVLQQGKFMGWDNATIAEHQAKEVSTVWSERLRRQMLNDPLGAQKLYQDNIAAILPEQRPILEHELKQQVMPVQAKNLATEIMAPDMPKGGDFITAKAVRANIGKWRSKVPALADKLYLNDPIFRDMVDNQLTSYANKVVAADEAVTRNARDDIVSAAMGSGGQKPTTLDELLSDPKAKQAWPHLDAMSQMSALNLLDHNAKGIDPPETPEAQNTWHELRGMAYSDPEAFKEKMADPKTFKMLATELPHSFMNELIGLDSSLDKATAKDQSTALNIRRIQTETLGLLPRDMLENGKAPTKNEEKVKVYNNYLSRMQDQVQQYITDNKKRPDSAELRKMAQQLLIQGYESGSGWFGSNFRAATIPAFQAQNMGKFAIPVPEADRPALTQTLTRKYGRPPTSQELDQAYAAWTMGQKK